MLTTLEQSLTRFVGGPKSDVQNLKHFSRWQVREGQPTSFLFVGCQLNWTALEVKTPRLEQVNQVATVARRNRESQ